jgi:deoxyribose-phosphate aldolase
VVTGGNKMDNNQLLKEVQDLGVKVAGAINLMKDAKYILVYNKLLGLSQKIGVLCQELSKK